MTSAMENNIEIFISYAWKDSNQSIEESREKIVDEICASFAKKKYEIVRDKNHLTYKQSIKRFMDRIGQGNYIIAVISDKYLKSEYCMYEAYEMFQSKHFQERVFPIVLNDADIFSIECQTDYLVFWGNRLTQLQEQAERLKEINQTMTVPLIERRREVELMSYRIADFIATVADMNVLTPEIHSETGFQDLIKAIEMKIRADNPSYFKEHGQLPISNAPETDEFEEPEKPKEIEVHISFAWGGKSEEIVDHLDISFQERGITIIRDKRDLGFKGRIQEFRQRIAQGNAVVVIISDKYLKSVECMLDLIQIVKNERFYDRIFPIIMEDARIYRPIDRIRYIKYWEDKVEELEHAMHEIKSSNLQDFREDVERYTEIRNTIAGIMNIFKDMNTLTPNIHQDSNFEILFTALQDKLGICK